MLYIGQEEIVPDEKGGVMPKIKFNEEIYKKALKVIKLEEYEQVCNKAGICPKCGARMETIGDELGFPYETCPRCGYLPA